MHKHAHWLIAIVPGLFLVTSLTFVRVGSDITESRNETNTTDATKSVINEGKEDVLRKNQTLLVVEGIPSQSDIELLNKYEVSYAVSYDDIVRHPEEAKELASKGEEVVVVGDPVTEKYASAMITGISGVTPVGSRNGEVGVQVPLGISSQRLSEAGGDVVSIPVTSFDDPAELQSLESELEILESTMGVTPVSIEQLTNEKAEKVGWKDRAVPAFVTLSGFSMYAVNQAFAVTILVLGGLTILRAALLVLAAVRHDIREKRKGGTVFEEPVTVLVPAYYEEASIAASLRSLVETDYKGELRIIVIDDGSEDDTSKVVKEFKKSNPQHDITLLRQENAGKAAALNTGLSHAETDIVIMVDGDTIFEPKTIPSLMAPFADEKVGAVSGNARIINRQGFIGRAQHIEYVVGFNLDRRFYDLARCMPTVPGAVGAFRRNVVESVGGLATDTLAEDTDLTMAVNRAGYDVIYAPDAIAHTEAPQTWRALWKQRYRWTYGTMQAAWKHKASLFDTGKSGIFGRRGMTYLVTFQMLLPLFGFFADLLLLWIVIFGEWKLLLLGLLFILGQMLMSALAFKLDKQHVGSVLLVPVTQFVYRQMMYLVVMHSLWTAMTGVHLPWQRTERYGTLATANAEAVGN